MDNLYRGLTITARQGKRSDGGETPIGNAVCIFVVRSVSEWRRCRRR